MAQQRASGRGTRRTSPARDRSSAPSTTSTPADASAAARDAADGGAASANVTPAELAGTSSAELREGRYYSRARARGAERTAREADRGGSPGDEEYGHEFRGGWGDRGSGRAYGSMRESAFDVETSGMGYRGPEYEFGAEPGSRWDREVNERPITDLGDRNPSQGFAAPREGGALGGEVRYPPSRATSVRARERDIPREGGRRSRWRREPLLAREIMTKNPRCAQPDTSIQEVARIMREENTGIVPVIDGDGTLQGVITDRDIVMRAVAEGKNPLELRARDLMSDDVDAVHAEEAITDITRLMGDKQIRRVPVVDERDRVIGIIAMGDIATRADYDEDLQDALTDISATRSFWQRLFA